MSKLEEMAAEERRNYMREWRAKNKERVKVYNRNYWLKKVKNSKNEAGRAETLSNKKGESDED